MGMLEDQAAGLTPEEQDKARALYMHSIDPENYPDPDAPEPIPMFHPGEEPDVQPEGAYTNNVQDEKVDDEDPFADAEYADESPSPGDSADEDDPFADAEIAPDGYVSEEVDPDDPFAEAEYETPPEPEEEAPEPEPEEDDDPTWQDYGRSVMSGGAQIGSGVGWLMRKMGLEKAGRAVQDRSAESARAWMEDKLDVVGLDQKGLSPQARKALATEFLGEGDLGDKWNHAKLATAQSLLGTMAGMGLGGVFTKGLGAVGVGGRTGAAIGYGAGEAGVAAPSTGAATEEEVLGMGHEQLMGSLEYQAVYDGLSGLPEEERQQKAKALVADAAAGKAAAITSVTTFILSAPFSNTLGKVTGNIPNARGRVGSTIAGAGEEATQEFLQSGAETMASNLAIQQEADPTREITEGALESAVGGAAAGGLMGGVMGAAAGPQTELDQEASDLAAEIERTNAEEAGETEEAEDVQGPMPQTREEQEAEIEKQAEESAGRVQDIENAQDSARERVLANGGDLLDAELEAAKVGADMGMVDSDIQRHINMVNRQTEGALTKREEEEKAKAKDLKTAVKETKKAAEEDKAYEQKDKVSGIGQTGNVGYIAESPATDETVAGEKGDGVVRGNQLAEAFAKAANEAATSPENELAPPTPAQKEAGNYKKGHQRINGLDVTIENPAGSTREAADGSWKQDMKDHYGYIKGTESAEGKTEQLDVFVGDKPESKEVFVVDQINKEGNFDEHKVMMGYGNAIEARRAYARNYPQGFKVGKITTMSVPKFKEWLKNGDQTQPIQPTAKAGGPLAASAGQQKEVIQPKTLDGERTTRTLTAAEQAEQRIEQMPGRKVRYRLDEIEKQPKSPALKKFLEGSKMQAPVYHGTSSTNIQSFRGKGLGIHVGTTAAANDRLSWWRADHHNIPEDEAIPEELKTRPLEEKEPGGQNILPVYISAKNPLKVESDTGFGWAKSFLEVALPVHLRGKVPKEWLKNPSEPEGGKDIYTKHEREGSDFRVKDDGVKIEDVRVWLQSLGYDSVEYTNAVEDPGSTSYILFEPNQIKSAVGNKGTYDAKDKRIRYRLDDNVDSNELRARLNKENDGFTVDNKTGKDKKSGFAAGLGKEKVFAKRPTAKQIDAYRKQHAVLLAEEGNYLGAWVYGGEYFMDVSKVYPDTDMGKKRAYEAGKSIGEFGVQDLSKPPEEGYIPIEYKEGEREAIRAALKPAELTSWLEGSAVQNVVYHATTSDFTKFRKGATYFTNEPGFATRFTGEGASVMPVYISIKKPYRIDGDVEGRHFDWDSADIKRMKAEGYDGVIVTAEGEADIYTTFNPSQVKSAVGNVGTYSKRTSDLRYRKEEADGDKYFDERAWRDAEAEARGNSRTAIIHITPDQFLRMAETLTRPDEQKAMEVGMLMDEGVAFNSMPILIFQNQGNVAKTTGHEGRHRALALKAKGVKSMPVRLISGEGGPVGAIRFNYHEGAVPSTMEGQSGGVMKFPWSPEPAAAAPEEAPHEGRAFKNFFSAVTKGLTGTSSTGAPYKPVISAVADAMSNTASPVSKYSQEYIKHRGKFDDHIAFSIPGYKEVQQAVGSALVSNYGNMDTLLDIGASEGSFAKAVTALSGMKSTSLDPNPDMERSFNDVSSVPGAEYSMTALGAADQEGETAWVEDDGTEVPYFDPMGKTYDVVHEAMVFQFVSNERQEQFKRVKELVSANGLFITEEKVFTANQAANEAKKNTDHKALYFEKKDLDAKSAEVLEGMHKNMVHESKIEEELAANFKYVYQFWDSGNFKGYMASDSRTTIDNVINSMPSLKSDFSTNSTPRVVSTGNTRKRIGGNEKVNVPMTSAKAKEVLAPYTKKMPLLEPQILANPSEAPAEIYNQMRKDGALKAKGVFDPETGKLYIFSENHDSDADVVRTLLHEGVAHKGLRYLLGDKFEDTMNDVFKNGDQDAMARIARKYGLDPGNAEDIVEIAEEYVAYLAEHGVQSTVLQRVLAAVRQALRSVGVVKKWSDADLHALLARSGRKLKGKPMRKAMITKSFVVEGTGEQVEIEVSADVEMRNIIKRKEACEKVRKCIK